MHAATSGICLFTGVAKRGITTKSEVPFSGTSVRFEVCENYLGFEKYFALMLWAMPVWLLVGFLRVPSPHCLAPI